MANVLDIFAVDDITLLYELSDNLEGCLLNIAFGGGAEDVGYIRAMQRSFRERYDKRLEPLRILNGAEVYGGLNLCTAIGCILTAYYGLQGILDLCRKDKSTPEDRFRLIEEEAKDLLYENLIFPEDMDQYGEVA